MKFLSAVSAETLFLISVCVLAVGFTACLFMSVFKTDYGLKKRAWFLLIAAACCSVLKARSFIVGGKDFSPLLFFLCAVLALPLYFIRVKPRLDSSQDEKRRNFVRQLDERIRGAGAEIKPRVFPERKETEQLVAKPEQNAAADELDFSHVKSVLQRLEPAELTYADRRQIHELELALYAAERGDGSKENKIKINEGLGNLLKIMAKHGV